MQQDRPRGGEYSMRETADRCRPPTCRTENTVESMTEKVTVCVHLDRWLAETVDMLWPKLGMGSSSELIRALLAEFVKHKIEEEKDDFEILKGRW